MSAATHRWNGCIMPGCYRRVMQNNTTCRLHRYSKDQAQIDRESIDDLRSRIVRAREQREANGIKSWERGDRE